MKPYKEKKVVVHDSMQDGYTYRCIEPPGKNFYPDFKPDLTPKDMLSLGVFGGKYMTDCKKEFPPEWFSRAKLSPLKKDISLNYFKVDASQPLKAWKEKGWIHPDDPRGWFQWYCRYFQGRRHEDDMRQIQRWKAMKRHVAQIQKHCKKGDVECRKKQRQALLHWAYDARRL